MASRATSESQLAAQLIGPLQQATQYVVDKILEENQEQVQNVVYDAYSPTIYERTYELLDSWKGEATQNGNNHIQGKFEYDSSKISATSVITDQVVSGLAEIVYQGLAGHIFGEGPWTSKRNAFQALEKAVGANTIRQWMKEGMTAAGLPWVSHGGGIRA